MLQLIRKQTSKLLTKKKKKSTQSHLPYCNTTSTSLQTVPKRTSFRNALCKPKWVSLREKSSTNALLHHPWARMTLSAPSPGSLLSPLPLSTSMVFKPSGRILGNFWLLPEPPVVGTLLNGNSRQKSEHGYCKTSRMQSREVSVGWVVFIASQPPVFLNRTKSQRHYLQVCKQITFFF